MNQSSFIEIRFLDEQANALIELKARLRVDLFDDEDGDVHFEIGSIESELDAVEIFDYIKKFCYESLELFIQPDKCIYFLLDELVVLFAPEFYSSEDALSILTNAVNISLSRKLKDIIPNTPPPTA